jgi:hypothetical protein
MADILVMSLECMRMLGRWSSAYQTSQKITAEPALDICQKDMDVLQEHINNIILS